MRMRRRLGWGVTQVAAMGALLPATLVWFVGESNSGGLGTNALLTTAEKASRTTKIWNPTAAALQALLIGTNNLISHTGLTNNATHGIENGLANTYDTGRWGTDPLYIVKCGQGGSTISQWAAGNGSGYLSTAISRFQAAVAAIRAAGYEPRVKVFLSIGINDAIVATAGATFQTGVETLMAALRTEAGTTTPIALTNFMADYNTYNSRISDIVALSAYNFLVDTTDLDEWFQLDRKHWEYAPLRVIAERFTDKMMASATASTVSASPAAGTYGSTQSVSISDTLSRAIRYRLDGVPATSIDTLYSSALSVDVSKRVTATGLGIGAANGNLAADYVIGTPWSEITWTGFTNASQNGNYLTITAASGGARANNAFDATVAGAIYIDASAECYNHAVVFYLDSSSGTNYAFNATNDYLAGFYFYNNSQANRTVIGGSVASTGAAAPWPSIRRLSWTGSNNDVSLHYSVDGGSTWVADGTFSGVLSGVTTMYFKCLLAAVDTAGARRIRVRYS